MDKTAIYSKAFLESIHGISEKEVLLALARFKEVLKKREEMHLYPRILKNVIASLEYRENATVVSARSLDKTIQSDILKMLKKRFPEMTKEHIQYHINEKMLGGVSIAYQDFLFDGTVKGTLRKLMGNTKK
ncbi:MAG: F0F1 ATP synthase subunit delta [Candidatus Paceibacterota bacterium]|jgi:F0F1-type ATP synthase delta subunit|nr:F0F1 ATP synthase subunit delta [Candidatus Paceibacterota bacterium]